MWRFCDITGRNRPVLSLHHKLHLISKIWLAKWLPANMAAPPRMGWNPSGWGETDVLMEVSFWRLAPAKHRHLPAHGLLSLFSFLRAFLLTAIKRNQAPFSGTNCFFTAWHVVEDLDFTLPGKQKNRPWTNPKARWSTITRRDRAERRCRKARGVAVR